MISKAVRKRLEKIMIDLNASNKSIKTVKQKIEWINEREKDPHLYIGIVGEFSSGKSTLINSLIGENFFSTGVLQGTTTIATWLTYSSRTNITVLYKDGRKIKYSNNKFKLLKEYLPDTLKSFSAFKIFGIKFKDFFGVNSLDSEFLPLFDVLTTDNEIAQVAEKVEISHPVKVLKNGLVIIDTPGTESLNPEHLRITRQTIANQCDLALVIVPAADRSLTQTLSTFIKDNLSPYLEFCAFLATKIELIRTKQERNMTLENIKNRLQLMFDIDSPNVVSAATLLDLIDKGEETDKSFLDHLDQAERKSLVDTYRQNVEQLFDSLIKIKQAAILNKINVVLDYVKGLVTKVLNAKTSEKKEKLDVLKALKTMPLSEFIGKSFSEKDAENQFEIARITSSNACGDAKSSTLQSMRNQIGRANSKDEIQASITSTETTTMVARGDDKCYSVFIEEADKLVKYYIQRFENFKENFTKTFKIEAADFDFSIELDEKYRAQNTVSFNNSSITTGLIGRWLMSRESVREEMMSAVNNAFEYYYNQKDKWYTNNMVSINNVLVRRQRQAERLFYQKYDKIINKRIKEEETEERILTAEIKKLNANLNFINSINAS